jgi:hypothetical protein
MSRPPEAWLKRVLPRIGYGDKIMWRFPDLEPLGQVSRIVPAAGTGLYLAGNEVYKDGKLPGYKDGKIYSKPANRGKFTALKKRTGHSATWFKKNGTPAQKKMATFALNAKKWNHK